MLDTDHRWRLRGSCRRPRRSPDWQAVSPSRPTNHLLGVSLFSLAASCASNRTRTMSRLSSVMPLVEPSPLVGGRAEMGHPPFDNGSNSGQLKIDRTQTAIDLAATLSPPGRRRTPRQT